MDCVKMRGKLDFIDLRILEGLGTHGPRNVTEVARKLGMPAETVRKRIKRMPSRISFRLHTNIYCTNLGLKKAVVLAEAIPGHEDMLFDCLQANDFWVYLARCYGMNEGCIGVYTIPNNHSPHFVQFIHSMEEIGVAKNVQIIWSTCFQSVQTKTRWFDKQLKTWILSWDKWADEVQNEEAQLPYTLIDPEDYPVKADKIDVFVLKELEKNPTISLSELAKILGVSQQVVEYHYKRHILERNLIEGFEVATHHFDTSVSDFFVFVFRFDSAEGCAKFASSLLDKPFIGGLGKILNENALLADVYLPKLEFRKFIDTLSKLVRDGLLHSYEYVILDLRKAQRQTISYERFKDRSWIYDHKRYMQNLQGLVDLANLER